MCVGQKTNAQALTTAVEMEAKKKVERWRKEGNFQEKRSDKDFETGLDLSGKEETSESTGTTCYMKAYKTLKMVPVIRFVEGIENSEMFLMHWGCGLRHWNQQSTVGSLGNQTLHYCLNLRDNWMEGMGGAAEVKMLKKKFYITEVDLSDNNLGDFGARAISATIKENGTLLRLHLSGNHFTDQSTDYLASALITNSTLQHLHLSCNALGEHAGKPFSSALSENQGLRSLIVAWNCI
ncbi:hypothetical protein CCH79_00013302, partial [Gambusia affinis]